MYVQKLGSPKSEKSKFRIHLAVSLPFYSLFHYFHFLFNLQLLQRGSFSSTGMKNKENVYNVLREINFFVFNLIFTCFGFNFVDDKNELNSRGLSAHEMISFSPKKQCFSRLQSQSARFKMIM